MNGYWTIVQQAFLYGRMLPSNFMLMFRYPTCRHVSSRRHMFQGPWVVFFVFGDWWIRLQTMNSLDTSFVPHAFPWINRQTQVKAGNRITKKTCCNLRTQTRSILGAFEGFSRVFIHKVEKTHMLVPIVFSGRWTTVDGWNPALIDGSFIPLFTGFYTSQVVVWDFFHQQYGPIQTICEYIACQEAWLLYRHAIVIVVTFKVLLLYISRCSDSRCWQLTRYTTHAHTSKCCWAFHVNELRRKTCCLIQHSASVATIAARNRFVGLTGRKPQ